MADILSRGRWVKFQLTRSSSLYTGGLVQMLGSTHVGLSKMVHILQTTFWSAFSWMKNIQLSLNCVPKVPTDNAAIGSGNGLAQNRQQATTWANDDQDPWHNIAWPGHNGLSPSCSPINFTSIWLPPVVNPMVHCLWAVKRYSWYYKN